MSFFLFGCLDNISESQVEIVKAPLEVCEQEKEIMVFSSFKDEVYFEIKKFDIKYPEIVIRQAIVETGHFKSRIFKENHNLFGMKVPYNRKKSKGLIGKHRGHAKYKCWQASVEDYSIWQKYMINKGYLDTTTEQAYLLSLDNMYAEDPNYIHLLKRIDV